MFVNSCKFKGRSALDNLSPARLEARPAVHRPVTVGRGDEQPVGGPDGHGGVLDEPGVSSGNCHLEGKLPPTVLILLAICWKLVPTSVVPIGAHR